MGKRYLIDTNVLVDVQTQKMPSNGLNMIAVIANEDFTISFVSYIEFLGYKEATVAMVQFAELANVIEVNKAVIDATILLRKSRKIKLGDAIIAATAIVYNRILITRNTNDFDKITGLNIVNPWEL